MVVLEICNYEMHVQLNYHEYNLLHSKKPYSNNSYPLNEDLKLSVTTYFQNQYKNRTSTHYDHVNS